ncbi:hypothetical protein FACS1894200_00070 [Spirochaetia bacterium]|nr:hypothetical protein FACS1894200_00070 [Spirochaetia bacterium]
MARISWIKDNLNGRLDSIVGSSWKGIPYVKTFVAPSNPDSPAQRQIRGAFRHLTHIGNAIRQTILSHAWPAPHKQTATNAFVHLNKHMLGQAIKWIPAEMQLMNGEMNSNPITAAIADAPNAVINVSWINPTTDPDNKPCIMLYDETSGVVQSEYLPFDDAAIEFSDPRIDYSQPDKVHIYLAWSNDVLKQSSATSHKVCTV